MKTDKGKYKIGTFLVFRFSKEYVEANHRENTTKNHLGRIIKNDLISFENGNLVNIYWVRIISCINPRVYYRGNENRYDEILNQLEALGGKPFTASCRASDSFYYINPRTMKIEGTHINSPLADILKDCYVEKSLPGMKTIEIDGKTYYKDDVIERLKELKDLD